MDAATNSTDPLVMLVWDISETGGVLRAVAHFGTAQTCRNLRRRKRLPTFEEVRAAEMARPKLYLGSQPDF